MHAAEFSANQTVRFCRIWSWVAPLNPADLSSCEGPLCLQSYIACLPASWGGSMCKRILRMPYHQKAKPGLVEGFVHFGASSRFTEVAACLLWTWGDKSVRPDLEDENQDGMYFFYIVLCQTGSELFWGSRIWLRHCRRDWGSPGAPLWASWRSSLVALSAGWSCCCSEGCATADRQDKVSSLLPRCLRSSVYRVLSKLRLWFTVMSAKSSRGKSEGYAQLRINYSAARPHSAVRFCLGDWRLGNSTERSRGVGWRHPRGCKLPWGGRRVGLAIWKAFPGAMWASMAALQSSGPRNLWWAVSVLLQASSGCDV